MMVEIKCPMCGKYNDDQLEVCQFCKARLKPLIASDAGSGEKPYWEDSGQDKDDENGKQPLGNGEPDDDAIDWLQDLSGSFDEDQTEEDSEPAVVSEGEETGDEADDLVDNLRDRLTGLSAQDEGSDSEAQEETADSSASVLKQPEPSEDDSLFVEDAEDLMKGSTGWLSSLGSGDDTEDESAFPETSKSDWLTDPDKTRKLDDSQEGESEASEWLSDKLESAEAPVKGYDETGDDEPEPETAAFDDETVELRRDEGAPDWLAAMHDGDADSADELIAALDDDAGEPAEKGEIPEWLAAMQDDDDVPADEPTAVEDEPEVLEPAKEGETPEWFAGMQDDDDVPADEPDAVIDEPEYVEPAEEGETPEWLAAMREDDDVPADEPTAVEDEAEVVETTEEPEDVDWLTGEKEGDDVSFEELIDDAEDEAEEAVEEAETTDWLSETQEGEDVSEDELTDDVIDEEDAEEPETMDWLAAMSGEEADYAEELSEEDDDEVEEPKEKAQIPDWLEKIKERETEIADEVVAAVEDDVDEVLESAEPPEWLDKVVDDIPEDLEDLEPGERPDWLQELDDLTAKRAPLDLDAEDLEEVVDEVERIEPGEEPDWLKDLGYVSGAAAVIGKVDDSLDAAEDAHGAVEDALDAAEDGLDVADDTLGAVDDSLDAVDDSLDAAGVPEPEPVEEAKPIGTDLFPDWLSDEDLSDLVEVQKEKPVLDESEIPNWLEDIRPVEATPIEPIPPDEPVVGTGPLRGLRSVLSAGDEAVGTAKTPAYSIRLEVDDNQRVNAKILQQMVEAERDSIPVPTAKSVTTQNVFRNLIGLLMVAVVALAILFGSASIPTPSRELIPAEVMDSSRMINAITAGDPVLLSFDYEPGSSPEMEASAAPVVDHLMVQGAYLSMVSTTTTGPALAEHFINSIQAVHSYRMGEQYINLGYIPGEASGLQAFLQLPQWVLPVSFNGLESWKTQPLEGVVRLSDFKMVLVITDKPETARAWIEQVQPYLENTPMVFVTSAQAAPMVRPYYAGPSAQVSGLVNSLLGAAAYEQVIGRHNLSVKYWNGFTAAVLIGIAIMIVGGLLNAVSTYLNSRSRMNDNERKDA